MTEAEYALYREVEDAQARLPPLSALAFIEQAAAQSGNSVVAVAVLAILAVDRGQLDLAKRLCAKMLAEGRSSWALTAEAYRQGRLGNQDGAWDTVRQAVAMDELSPFALAFACVVATMTGEIQAARSLAERRYRADPANPRAYRLVVSTRILEHDPEAARTALGEAPVEFLQTGAYHGVVGGIARLERRYVDAAEELKLATELDPFNSTWWFQLGDAYLKLKMVAEAKTAATQAHSLEPCNASALTILARVAESEGAFQERDRWYEEASRCSPFAKAVSHGRAANVFMKAGMPIEALRAIKLMERAGSHSVRQLALIQKLCPLADLGRWHDVEQTLASLQGRPISQGPVEAAKARLRAHRHDVKGAMEILERQFEAEPRPGESFRWLLIFSSEARDLACLNRVVERILAKGLLSGTEADSFTCSFYAVQEFEHGDRILREALARFPESKGLQTIEAWRRQKTGDTAGAQELRRDLSAAAHIWKPRKTLRPPKQTFFHVLGLQFRMRLFGR